MPVLETQIPVSFLPALAVGDALAAYWLRNVTLRLRREVCWMWHQRAPGHNGHEAPAGLPPFADRLADTLDLTRYASDRMVFFARDETAAFLSAAIAAPPGVDSARSAPARGSFSWVVRELELGDVDCFALALALGPALDSAAGAIYAACLNDPARTTPTLALAQRLWDDPAALLPLTGPAHALLAHGLLTPPPAGAALTWDSPLAVPPAIAAALAFPGEGPPALRPLTGDRSSPPPDAAMAAARLRSAMRTGLRIVPVLGPRGAALAANAATVARLAGRELVVAPTAGATPLAHDSPALAQTLTLCWLGGTDLFVPFETLVAGDGDAHHAGPIALPQSELPVAVFVGLHDRSAIARLPASLTLPALHVPAIGYRERLELWQAHLPGVHRDPELAAAVADCARRFRGQRQAILDLCDDLRELGRPVQPADVLAACRADIDLGDLAQPVAPRFRLADIMLPRKQARQLREVIQGMRALTTVHYEWGTARAWNEGGLSALFAGPPGTGKTMAAEVIANELGLPLFRIDLSQVVNKYIGETEKNLRRVFDGAEASDVILFFDEADSLFGKRTEVKDAHDRYANLEVSYLLERMERFKGLAILATNRKKDLDDAFLRRLRFLIDFPLPGADERLQIWKGMVPEGVDASDLDFAFLARRFPLAGGHIRSIVFHACLQLAAETTARRLTMPAVVAAVKREYDKLDRGLSLEQYGPFAGVVEKLS